MTTVMKKISSLFLFFILAVQCTSAQTNLNTYKNQLKFSPFRLIDPVNPGVELSYERLHGKNFSTQLSVAYMTDPLKAAYYSSFKGFRLALEEKYFIENTSFVHKYFSTDIVFCKTTINDIGRFGIYESSLDSLARLYNYADSFTVHKQTLTLNFKLGFQIIKKHFVIDMCMGVGVKYKDVQHSDRLIPTDKMEIPRHPNVYYYSEKEGKYFTMNIPMNIKIGYIF